MQFDADVATARLLAQAAADAAGGDGERHGALADGFDHFQIVGPGRQPQRLRTPLQPVQQTAVRGPFGAAHQSPRVRLRRPRQPRQIVHVRSADLAIEQIEAPRKARGRIAGFVAAVLEHRESAIARRRQRWRPVAGFGRLEAQLRLHQPVGVAAQFRCVGQARSAARDQARADRPRATRRRAQTNAIARDLAQLPPVRRSPRRARAWRGCRPRSRVLRLRPGSRSRLLAPLHDTTSCRRTPAAPRRGRSSRTARARPSAARGDRRGRRTPTTDAAHRAAACA